MPLQLRLLVALLALLSLLAARHLHRRQQATGADAAHARLLMPLGTLRPKANCVVALHAASRFSAVSNFLSRRPAYS